MSNNLYLNRVKDKILSHFVSTSLLYNIIESFTRSNNKEDIEKMIKGIETFNIECEALKNSIQTLLQHIGNVDIDEVDVTKTENGFEL